MRVVRRALLVVAVGLVLVAGWLFAARNDLSVAIDLLILQVPEVRLWAVLVGSFVLGAAAAGFAALYEVSRLGLLARRYRKTVVRLESEIHQLRNLPLAAEDGSPPPAPAALPQVGAGARDG
ncbi:MAG: lipopolysaccharide assembly protein LapA domain-containing protein [Myxococcota bacterium]